jgi:triosephosphate isomerase (TIM)
MTRKKIVAGNWKMNTNLETGIQLAADIVYNANNQKSIVILCPPFISLYATRQETKKGNNIFIGAQNCYTAASGAYTGEISMDMIKSTGAKYVLVGHSERRTYFHEKDAFLAEKVNVTLAGGLSPIYCCGEALDIREAGTHVDFVAAQMKSELFHLSAEDFAKVVIAYEPVWAIGTGVTASPAQAQEMHLQLRQVIADKYGNEVAQATTILYGGSVSPSNAKELFSCPDVDGGLVGGASLQADMFLQIIGAMEEVLA